MQSLPIIFAASFWERLQNWRVRMGHDFNLLVFFGSFALLTLALFAWAIVFRKQPHRHHHHHHRKPAAAAPPDKSSGKGVFARHKHRRKQHRPVNPTLAETGGLPAARDPKTPPKAHL